MNSYEKRLTLNFALNIFLLLIIAVLLSFFIDIYISDINVKVVFYTLLIGLFLFVSIFLAKYFLTPMFETKRLLELLLKDTLHELNIPLSVIQANLQMLRRGELDQKRLKRIHRIELAGEDLKRLYRDMDYYIKKEVRSDVREEFLLENLIETEIEKFQFEKETIEYQAEQSVTLKADRYGFSRVISNLLSNAIKYNKDINPIVIEYKDKRLSIKDSGIGMNESEVFKIFDRYYQEDSTKDGFGIGLSIVKAYCDEQKIFINISSKLGIGTTVSLDLKEIVI